MGGKDKFAERKVWRNMLYRCSAQTADAKLKRDYFDRGITVCDRWRVFENFLADMGLRPTPEHSIDRIDNDGNYEPSNCRWATLSEQNGNRRFSEKITFNGKTMHLAEWARVLGMTRQSLRYRLNTRTLEDALTPSRRQYNR